MALTTTYQLKTFLDLYTAVREELKIQSTDTTAINRIKRDLNIVYLEEVVPFAQWKWLRGVFDATVYASITAGTANATQGSNTITLTVPIASPKNGWLFGLVGYSEVYRIANHAANSATLTLQAPYTGVTNATGQYKIWTDEIYLPSFVRETFEITHDFQDQPLENCGLQKYRSYVASLPRAEGRPYFYTTNTYTDPVQYASQAGIPAVSQRSSNTITKTLVFASDVSNFLQQGDRIQVTGAGNSSYNGEFVISTQNSATITFTGMVPTYEAITTETAAVIQKLQPSSDARRAKRVLVYPAIFNQNTTLHIDYIREVIGMADDTDEPLMPIGDRTILLYGGLQRAWSRERNPEEAKRNQELYDKKLIRMTGKMDDSIDQPILRPSKIYLGAKRMAQRQKDTRNGLPEGWGGGNTGGQNVTGSPNFAAIFNSQGSLTASSVSTTQLNLLIPVNSALAGISDTATLTNKSISALTNTITSISDTSIASNAAISFSKLAVLNTGQIIAGNSTSSSAVTMGGDASINAIGAVTISSSAITTSKMSSGSSSANTVLVADGLKGNNYQQLTDASLSGLAGISFSKLANLASGQIIAGNASTATALTLSADATISNTGALTISSSAIGVSKMTSSTATSGTVLTADGVGGQSYQTVAAAPDSCLFYENGSISTFIASSALSVQFNDKTGAAPTGSSKITVSFRNSSSADGRYTVRTVTQMKTVTIQNGNSLGLNQGAYNYAYVYMFDNNGSVEGALSGSSYWDEGQLQSITKAGVGSSGNLATNIYGSTAFSNVAIRLVGRLGILAASSGYPNTPKDLANVPFPISKQFVVGSPQTADGTTSSASFATPTNAPTVTFVAQRSGSYMVSGSFAIQESLASNTQCRIAATTGSPAIVFNQETAANIGVATAYSSQSPYIIASLVAGTSYTFTFQMLVASGTGTLLNSVPTNGHALFAQEL